MWAREVGHVFVPWLDMKEKPHDNLHYITDSLHKETVRLAVSQLSGSAMQTLDMFFGVKLFSQ